MPLDDPRTVLLGLFDPMDTDHAVTPGNLTIDNGSTQARYEAAYEQQEIRLSTLFHTFNLDVLFVIGRSGADPVNTPSGPIAYVHHLYVQPVAIDKYTTAGVKTVTGTIMADKASQEARRVVRANMSGSLRQTVGETATYERVGSSLIWGDVIGVDYTEWVSDY